MKTLIYTSEIDDRFGPSKVSSRIGLSATTRLFNPQTCLYEEIGAEHQKEPIHCVLVEWMKANF